MINKRATLPREACRFFGLSRDPFSEFPRAPEEVFVSPQLAALAADAIEAIKYQGFLAITGDIGSGKTVLRRAIEASLAAQPNLRLVFPETFDMAAITPNSIAIAILEGLGSPRIPRGLLERAGQVKRALKAAFQDGLRVAIAFDEAHRLSDPALSSLKNFLEMNSGGFQRYLGVALFGQYAFEARLKDFRFREIVERVEVKRMPEFEGYAEDYLRHRLRLAGGNADELFDAESLRLILAHAKTPLALGNLANFALMIAYRDFEEKRVLGEFLRMKLNF